VLFHSLNYIIYLFYYPYPQHVQGTLSDGHQHNVIPVGQLLLLSVSHLVEQGQLIVNHHHHHHTDTDQPTNYEVNYYNHKYLVILYCNNPSNRKTLMNW